jgi:hypothetical protein
MACVSLTAYFNLDGLNVDPEMRSFTIEMDFLKLGLFAPFFHPLTGRRFQGSGSSLYARKRCI